MLLISLRQLHVIRNPISQTIPLIIGHRGAAAVAPENTLASFARALDDGAAGIELDVRLAKDGVPVVIHDASLRRTGLTSGEVGRMTSRELAATDVGSWFNRSFPKQARSEYEHQRVPTLEEVFHFFTSRPGVIYVELKSEGEATMDLVQAVADSVRELDFFHRVVVLSFDHGAVAKTKAVNASIRTGALFEPRWRPSQSWRAQSMIDAAVECDADELLPHRLLARPKLIELAASRNLPVVVWTVDDPVWVERAEALGIHGLITNDPESLQSRLR